VLYGKGLTPKSQKSKMPQVGNDTPLPGEDLSAVRELHFTMKSRGCMVRSDSMKKAFARGGQAGAVAAKGPAIACDEGSWQDEISQE
jgi:hypothetical protein